MITLDNITGFEWDNHNENKIFSKHKITKKNAEDVFKDEYNLFSSAKEVKNETRYSVMGSSSDKKNIIVFFTVRKNSIRVISARPQSIKERKIYNETYKK